MNIYISKVKAEPNSPFLQTVIQAVVGVLGPAAIAAHKTLAASIPALDIIPVPGLVMAAKLLLGIWDAVQDVDVCRLSLGCRTAFD
jgi:hypothetical protein